MVYDSLQVGENAELLYNSRRGSSQLPVSGSCCGCDVFLAPRVAALTVACICYSFGNCVQENSIFSKYDWPFMEGLRACGIVWPFRCGCGILSYVSRWRFSDDRVELFMYLVIGLHNSSRPGNEDFVSTKIKKRRTLGDTAEANHKNK